MHNLNDMMRIAQDVAAGREPDETYTKQMRAMWHQMDSELDVARRENPHVYIGLPADVDGMPDAPEPGPRNDDWSDAAREAALEARRANMQTLSAGKNIKLQVSHGTKDPKGREVGGVGRVIKLPEDHPNAGQYRAQIYPTRNGEIYSGKGSAADHPTAEKAYAHVEKALLAQGKRYGGETSVTSHGVLKKDYYDPEKATQPDPNTPPKPMVLNDDEAEAGDTGPDMSGRPLVPGKVTKKIKRGRGRSGTPAATKAPPGLGNAKPGEVVPAPKRKKKPGASPPPPPGMHSDDEE